MAEGEIREDNIFAKIGRGEVPVEPVYEDSDVIAFRDISPEAPVHVVVIPKRPVRDILGLGPSDRELAGALLLACGEVARRLSIDESGFRVVLNTGEAGGQTIPHLHAHVLGGRAMHWPPG